MEKSPTRSIERAFDILECFLGEHSTLTLKQIIQETSLSASTVHRLMATLEKRNYVVRDETSKEYALGSMVSKLGYVTTGKMGLDFKSVARKYMAQLHEMYNESISLYVLDGDKRLCIDRIESTHELRRAINIGSSFPLGIGAAGRVLVAYLDQDKVYDLYLDIDLTSPEYVTIKEQGFIISEGEREIGLSAVAAPIFDFTGKVIGALSLSGPSLRLERERLENIALHVKKKSELISQEMGY